MIYDVLIAGGGPAGLAAGIYASRAKLKTIILDKGRPGGQAATTMEMENYPGSFQEVTGPGLMKQFAEHAAHFGTDVQRGLVEKVDLDGPVKRLTTKDGRVFEARSVILAPGAEPRTLNIKGEGRLRGKGVSYCATCDADFFEDLDVVVVGNGDAAVEEAMYLTRFANEVTLIVIHDEGVLDCNKTSAERAMANPKIKWEWQSMLEEIIGDELVEKVILKDVKTGALREKETNGVFFFIGTVPKTEFLRDVLTLDEQGYILTNEMMETNIPGVYAAGDARAKYLRQVITAASDGAVAAVAAEKYLDETESFRHQVLEASERVLLTFWAPQSQESIEALAMLDRALYGEGGVSLAKLDSYRNKKTAALYLVKRIPTVLLFEDGRVLGRLEGGFTEADIKILLQQ
ncbi:MAG: thioredoxin-disulfide reductase [Clostridia bacterium]|nr:thioredoxin-disulfide reductase [Clostridia bacterium]